MKSIRYRTARDKADLLGQVFTPSSIADLLIHSINAEKNAIDNILDLGAGEGALTASALKHYTSAKALLIEIDPALAESTSSRMKLERNNSRVICASVFDNDWAIPSDLNLILSNPPYISTPLTQPIKDIITASNLSIPAYGNWIRSDLAFLAKAWEISSLGCNFGFIVASPIAKDLKFQTLRADLIGKISGLCVTQLHEKTFRNAEVQAFLISGRRAVNRRRNVLLRKALANGLIVDELEITYSEAICSLDIDYHRALHRMGLTATESLKTLASLGVEVKRGSKSLKDFERLGMDAFHTTDFIGNSSEISLRSTPTHYHLAKQGDILIPRVGSRCLIKQARVKKGQGLFTDCIYRLTARPNHIDAVWNTLNSSFGADWRLANAMGSCAKHITVQTLMGMPILSKN